MQLLICGIPGTGKSTFAEWLVSEHQYVRFPDQDEQPLTEADVNRALGIADAVIDWGFPAYNPDFKLSVRAVRELTAVHHFEHWWFDGDRHAALQSFLTRGTVSRAAWDRQLAGIDEHWDEIQAVFADRIVNVISDGASYMSNDERFERIRRADHAV